MSNRQRRSTADPRHDAKVIEPRGKSGASFAALCARIDRHGLIAAECRSLTGGVPDGDGVAMCDSVDLVARAAYVQKGLRIIARARSLDDLVAEVEDTAFDADGFQIDVHDPSDRLGMRVQEVAIRLADVIPFGPNLKNPEHRFVVTVAADELLFGEVLSETDASYRRHNAKPWTTSSSLEGRFARALVNLVPDARSILDPCCGAGAIVLEAALELKLKKDRVVPILKAFSVALIGLVASAWVAALILHQFIPEMTMKSAWLYATPLSILSSAIIIPSVSGLKVAKKEFHIYESTFSDIIGIMMFYFLVGELNPSESSGVMAFGLNLLITVVIAVVASYMIILIFQKIKGQVKLFLLIAVLLLLYALGKKMHLSSLIIILVFGLIIANMKLFFAGPLSKFLELDKANQIYHELHIITLETAFVVRTFFFVIFGLTIVVASLFNLKVALISLLLIASIYIIRFAILRVFFGSDIMPQLFIAPRGLITVLLFYAIPQEAIVETFEPGILLFVIIVTSLVMTWAMIKNGKKQSLAKVETHDKAMKELQEDEEVDYNLLIEEDTAYNNRGITDDSIEDS